MTVREALDQKRVERKGDIEAIVYCKRELFYLPTRGNSPEHSVYPVSRELAREEAEWFGVPFNET
jgi:hypothetical protein